MTTAAQIREQLAGVILAGGRATRMGGEDKGLIRVGDRTMVEHVLRALRPQVSDLYINANRNHDRYRDYGLPVISDFIEGYCGPLAGMASAMQIAKARYLLTAPCDSPFVSADLAARLYARLTDKQAQISVAESDGQLEPVFALIDCALLPSLLAYLEAGERKIDRWYGRHAMVTVDFSDHPGMFLNLNTPEDVAAAEERLRSSSPA